MLDKNRFCKKIIILANWKLCKLRKDKPYSPFAIIVESIVAQNKIAKSIPRRQEERQTRIRLIHLVNIFSYSYSIKVFYIVSLFFIEEAQKTTLKYVILKKICVTNTCLRYLITFIKICSFFQIFQDTYLKFRMNGYRINFYLLIKIIFVGKNKLKRNKSTKYANSILRNKYF